MNPLPPATTRVLFLSTQGNGSGDERRISYLLKPLGPRRIAVDRSRRIALMPDLLGAVRRHGPDLIVLEGTGLVGGIAVLLARRRHGVPYIVSTGDAVAPFVRSRHPWLWPIAAFYERLLYRASAGVIGWSPYLAGRALTLGASHAMTAAHFAPAPGLTMPRAERRRRLGIPDDAIVVGIAGSLNLNRKLGWCYGADLVAAVRDVRRSDIYALVVGDGDGLEHLRALAGSELDNRVKLPGRCAPEEVPSYLAAMDVGALSQSVDLVGSMRYTTKLPEYLAAGLPILVGEVPLAYDLDDGWLWRLPGASPWDEAHHAALVALLRSLTREEVEARTARVPRQLREFDASSQQHRVVAFARDAIERERARSS